MLRIALILAMLLSLAPLPGGDWGFGANTALADDDGDDGDDDGPAAGGRDGRGESPVRRAAPAAPRAAAPAAPAAQPAFAPAELVALGLNPADLEALAVLGYRVLDARPLPSLGGPSVFRLSVPPGRSLDLARTELRAIAPGATTDYNHFYRTEQAPACDGPACGPRSQIGWPLRPDAPVPGCDPGGAVGMIDTGVNAAHPALAGRAEVIRLDPRERAPSDSRHGTAVAALLVGAPDSPTPGLLPAARLIAVDAFHKAGRDERAEVFDLVTGLDLLAARGVQVVNLSLSGPANAVLERMVTVLFDRGILLVASVGNDGAQAGPAWPAAYPQVLAVTAVDARGAIYRRAVQGPHVELAAPGVQVWTAADDRGGRARNGTSFAAPFVTAAAHLLRGRGLDPRATRAALAASAVDLGDPGPDPVFGHGLLQAGGICTPSAG